VRFVCFAYFNFLLCKFQLFHPKKLYIIGGALLFQEMSFVKESEQGESNISYKEEEERRVKEAAAKDFSEALKNDEEIEADIEIKQEIVLEADRPRAQFFARFKCGQCDKAFKSNFEL
jgi:hypothetical protein